MRRAAIALLLCSSVASAAPPFHLWIEAERFRGVEGQFIYWSGTAKPTGKFAISGPGVTAEWSQGGESEWNSMGVPAEEKSARAWREVRVPHAGRWRVWVRAVDHRDKTEPLTVSVEQGSKTTLKGTIGLSPSVPRNDEYQLYWGFSFGWSSVDGTLAEGPAKIVLAADREGQGWRQIDAVVLTDDFDWQPVGREKPRFAYQDVLAKPPASGVRGDGARFAVGSSWKRPPLAGEDFTMWTNVAAPPATMKSPTPYDLYFETGLQPQFKKPLAGQRDVPLMNWPKLRPVFHLTTDLSPGTPAREFLDRTRIPFAILTNYAVPKFTDQSGPANYRALHDELKDRFLGFIYGESIGTAGVGIEDKALAPDRTSHLDAFARALVAHQADAFQKMFHTAIDPDFFANGIACLSSDLGNSFVHLFHSLGQRLGGYEEDSTVVHVPLKLMFQRGAARQYGQGFIDYASGNFGDACNYFTPYPPVACGSGFWFHSKYSITDGVTIGWYRKLYYLNYLGGASAIYWEQGLGNQYLQPGPGQHPVGLSPFGRTTKDFMEFVDRVPDRGEPFTPVAVLLGRAHGYSHVSFRARPFEVFDDGPADLELRELFNVLYFPSPILEGQPQAPDLQSLPPGVFGNLFDALVDRPERQAALYDYPIVWLAGDVKLGAPFKKTVEEHLRRGGTWVLTSDKLGELPAELTNVRGAKVLLADDDGKPLVVRNAVGAGAVITILVPHGIGPDERAHPAVAWVANALFRDLSPVQVRRADGTPLQGEVLWQLNRTKRGWLVLLINNHGVDKTQTGLPRVDRRASVEVQLQSELAHARELTASEPLTVEQGRLRVTIPPGDLKVIELTK
jgi:hypothetical protein